MTERIVKAKVSVDQEQINRAVVEAKAFLAEHVGDEVAQDELVERVKADLREAIRRATRVQIVRD